MLNLDEGERANLVGVLKKLQRDINRALKVFDEFMSIVRMDVFEEGLLDECNKEESEGDEEEGEE
jgi:hypothetical protein